MELGVLKRPVAIIYALTVGLVVGVVIMVVGTVYGVIGTALRLGGAGEHQTRRPVSGPFVDVVSWWMTIVSYAATGRGRFTFVPEVET